MRRAAEPMAIRRPQKPSGFSYCWRPRLPHGELVMVASNRVAPQLPTTRMTTTCTARQCYMSSLPYVVYALRVCEDSPRM